MTVSIYTSEFMPMKREQTKNNKGFSYHLINAPIEEWVASDPISLPIADIGACYGVHTIYALRKGRDVIAADMDARHISELESRVAEQAQSDPEKKKTPGKLLAARVARIPQKDLLEKESVAGILISEVLHFLEPGEPLEVMKHCAEWLVPGGKLVIMAVASETVGDSTLKLARCLEGDRHRKLVVEATQNRDEDELLKNPPGILYLSEEVKYLGGAKVYMLSVRECEIMCRRAGLEVVQCEYVHTGKYGASKETPETVVLVAKKPNEART